MLTKGHNSKKGTEGVGRSQTTAVIVASLMVFILDLIAVQVTDSIKDDLIHEPNKH